MSDASIIALSPKYVAKMGKLFWAKVNKKSTDGCWLWKACHYWHGYGAFGVKRHKRYAHRVSWELIMGRIPAGKQVLHKCDIKNCVNPKHLYVGTHKENMADNSARGLVPSGKDHWSRRLTQNRSAVNGRFLRGLKS